MANETQKKPASSLSLDQFKVAPEKASKEDIAKALELLAKQKFTAERIKRGEIKGSTSKKVSEMTAEEKAKYQEYNKRLTAKNSILMQKAKKAGITVTEAEIDSYLAGKK
jgi:SOS-response transcriptional repressor LexA